MWLSHLRGKCALNFTELYGICKVKNLLTDLTKLNTKTFSIPKTVSFKYEHTVDIEHKHRISEMKYYLAITLHNIPNYFLRHIGWLQTNVAYLVECESLKRLLHFWHQRGDFLSIWLNEHMQLYFRLYSFYFTILSWVRNFNSTCTHSDLYRKVNFWFARKWGHTKSSASSWRHSLLANDTFSSNFGTARMQYKR